MATKRARITDRDPLTATDSVLAGYEQVNKSASQPPEVAVDRQSPHSLTSQPVNKSTSQQADDLLLTSEQPDQSTSQEVEIVKSSDCQPAIDKLASQQVSNLESQQPDQSGSQEVEIVKSSDGRKPEMDKSTSEEASKLESQQVNKLASQQVNNLKAASQQVNKLATEEVEIVESSVQQPETDNLASQQVSKPTIRKATFQIDAAILEALDRYHLQLQIEMGRRNAPYKEIVVEEAIAQWLERAAKSPERAVKSLLKRQEQR